MKLFTSSRGRRIKSTAKYPARLEGSINIINFNHGYQLTGRFYGNFYVGYGTTIDQVRARAYEWLTHYKMGGAI